MGRLSLWAILGLVILAISLHDVQVSAEVVPTESECRPYIEKAINELKGSDSDGADSSDTGSSDAADASTTLEPGGEETNAKVVPEDISAEEHVAEDEKDQSEETETENADEEGSGGDSEDEATAGDQDDSHEEQSDHGDTDVKDDASGEDEEKTDDKKTDDDGEDNESDEKHDDGEANESAEKHDDKAAEEQPDEGSNEEEKESTVDSDNAAESLDNEPIEIEDKDKEGGSEEDEEEGKEETVGKEEKEEDKEEKEAAEEEDTDDSKEEGEAHDAEKLGKEEEEEEEEDQNESGEDKEPEAADESKEDDSTGEDDSDSKEKKSDEHGSDSDSDESGEAEEKVVLKRGKRDVESLKEHDDDKEDVDETSQEEADDTEDTTESGEDDDTKEGPSDEIEETTDSKEEEEDEEKDEADEQSEEESTTEEADSQETESDKPEQEEEDAEEDATKGETAEKDEGEDEAEATEADATDKEGDTEEETRPEDDLLLEGEIPENLRDRRHIDELLHLDNEYEVKENAVNRVAEIILRDIKRIYENAIKPLEVLYKYRDLSNRHFGDPEIFSKPLVLFMGPWSGGKSTIINYLTGNEYTHNSLRSGAEPSPAYFNILMYGEQPEVLDGTQLAADWTFSGLQKFGQGLEDRLRGLKLPNKLLEKVNIVEIPGILEVRKQVSRLFPFNDACQWFIDRADIIFLVYDPAKLDVGPETEAILDQLKGREYQTRIILNKADIVKPEELLRVQSALIWNISPLMSSAQPPVMYTTSLWSHPYETTSPIRLLQAQERAFLRDLRTAIDKRIENKIASARRFAVRVRNHAKMVDCYLTTYYNHKTLFGNKKRIADQIIENPQDYHIYEGISTLTNISRYDLPDPEVYRDFFRLNPLYDFKKLSETCTYFRGCPINKLDVAIAYDLPELVGKYKKMTESALVSVEPPNGPNKS